MTTRQDDIVPARHRVNTMPCQKNVSCKHTVVQRVHHVKETLCQQRCRAHTTPFQCGVVPGRRLMKNICRVNMVSCQLVFLPIRHHAQANSCQQDVVSIRCLVNTALCQFDVVSKTASCQHEVLSEWCCVKTTPCRVKTTAPCQDGALSNTMSRQMAWCQDGFVPTRHRVNKTSPQHDAVSTRRRVRAMS